MFRDRVLLFSLVVSLFFHLSMVTLFSIEMRYEPKPIVYYPFDIVDVSELEQGPVHPEAMLDLPPEADAPFGGQRSAAEYLASLPQISLPTLDFEDIAQVSLREPDLVSSRPSLFEQERPRDPWAQFGQEIQDLRNTLRSLPLLDRLRGAQTAPAAGSASAEAGGAAGEILRPVPGLVARVEWMAEPRDRQLLFAPPVVLPWPEPRVGLTGPISFVFQVSPSGAVSDVVAPVGEHQDLIDAIAEALEGYRFEPRSGQAVQHAALVVEREETRP